MLGRRPRDRRVVAPGHFDSSTLGGKITEHVAKRASARCPELVVVAVDDPVRPMNGASSTVMPHFSTGVTRKYLSPSRLSTEANSLTSAARPIGVLR